MLSTAAAPLVMPAAPLFAAQATSQASNKLTSRPARRLALRVVRPSVNEPLPKISMNQTLERVVEILESETKLCGGPAQRQSGVPGRTDARTHGRRLTAVPDNDRNLGFAHCLGTLIFELI